jgi:type II secretion system protein H
MPTLSAECSGGFTLIEMLVVVLLVGLALGVGLTLDFNGSPQQQEQQARLFANELELAAQEAVLDGVVWGLDFFVVEEAERIRTGYRWLTQDADGWVQNTLPGSAAESTLFAPGTSLVLSLATQELLPEALVDLSTLAEGAGFMPEILVLPTRELEPFTLQLAADGNTTLITADLMGRVRMDDDAPLAP